MEDPISRSNQANIKGLMRELPFMQGFRKIAEEGI